MLQTDGDALGGSMVARDGGDFGANCCIGEIFGAPFSPGASDRQDAQRRENQHESARDPECFRSRSKAKRVCDVARLRSDGGVRRGEAEEVRVGALEVGDNTSGDDEFCQTGKGEMANHHGGDGDTEWVGRIQRRARSVMEEDWLNAKFHSGAKGGNIDGGIASESGS